MKPWRTRRCQVPGSIPPVPRRLPARTGVFLNLQVSQHDFDPRPFPPFFTVEAHDGVERFSRGRHERFVIRKDRFDAKVGEKQKQVTA